MHKQTFITLAVPGQSALDALLLAASIRRFAGAWADSPIWVFVPQDAGQLSLAEAAQFAELGVDILPFALDTDIGQFPFAAKIGATAVAENMALGQTELLTWLDRDTIVLNEPAEFMLPPGKALGYRPVHHRLIGPAWGEPRDPFWQLIYQHCRVPEGRDFRMTTHTGEATGPYFNAGSFVVRPERGLMAQWLERFQHCYRLPEFANFYEQDGRYATFMHQAVLTGVLLHALTPDEMQELSTRINYPLHLHDDIPADLRPTAVNELMTVRHESMFEIPDWQRLPIAEPLKSWLAAQPRLQKRP
ncbi:MAG: hypothetical protein H6662_14330 [Ardenticatenaceae bacterium]|nr:hypothetical protein [Ardenticatenaceae bacterium]